MKNCFFLKNVGHRGVRNTRMSDIPLQSRLDKSLFATQEYLTKKKLSKNKNAESNAVKEDGLHGNIALLLENQRIEDAYLIKESESKSCINT